MVNRRAHERSPIELAASFGVPDDPRINKEAKIKDISTGGFSFQSTEKVKVGAKIDLAIDSLEENIRIAVKVMWVKPDPSTGLNAIGVQIIEKPGPHLDKFLDFYSKTVKPIPEQHP